MPEDDDHILVKKVQAGDNDVFGQLVRKYQKQIYRKAYSFTRNVEDAHDLSQEIFIKAFKAIHRFKGSSAFYTWLYQIAHNSGIDYVRKKKRKKLITFADMALVNQLSKRKLQTRPVDLAERGEIDEQIKNAISKLSKRQEQVFVLRHFEGMNLKEIAEKLGLKIGSVKAHHFNAVRKLRKLLSHYVEE